MSTTMRGRKSTVGGSLARATDRDAELARVDARAFGGGLRVWKRSATDLRHAWLPMTCRS